MNDLLEIVKRRFDGRRVAVLGDAVADQFLSGTISRVSREAPVFILRHDETITLPGAAANAAANVASLGGKATLVGSIGDDANGSKLTASLSEHGIEWTGVTGPGLTTATKVRVLAGQHYAARQQVIRIDYEPSSPVLADAAASLRRAALDAISCADAVIVSDYGYGAVSPELFTDAVNAANERGIPLIVDSRYRLAELKGATTATPNREEVEAIVRGPLTDESCESLRTTMGLAALLVTNGNKGMTLFEDGSEPFAINAVGPTEPVDVTGAGDTVIAAYALSLASGMSFRDAATVANHAGGLVVMKKRTATVTADELLDSLRSQGL